MTAPLASNAPRCARTLGSTLAVPAVGQVWKHRHGQLHRVYAVWENIGRVGLQLIGGRKQNKNLESVHFIRELQDSDWWTLTSQQSNQ